MRILVVHTEYQQRGGEDTVVEQELSLLRQHGHEVGEYRRSNHEIGQLSIWNKLTLPKRIVWASDALRGLRKLIQETQPNVVHFHNTFLMISPAAYRVCRESEIPVVQTLHNFRLLCPNAFFFRDGHVCEDCLGKTPPWPGVIHRCYRDSRVQTAMVAAMLTTHRLLQTWQQQVNVYIALTEFSRRKFIEGGLPPDRLVVKPNFVHVDSDSQTDEEQHYMLFIGRLSPEKGIQTLLQAWNSMKTMPLKIVGDGPLRKEVESTVHQQQLEGVEVLGGRTHNEVLALMRHAYCLIVPSEWYEGFPMTIVEALACGLPVVVSRLGSMAEIVADQRTGLHFEPGDSLGLAKQIEWIFTHAHEVAQMRHAAREEYLSKYTPERNYQMLMNIYESAILNA